MPRPAMRKIDRGLMLMLFEYDSEKGVLIRKPIPEGMGNFFERKALKRHIGKVVGENSRSEEGYLYVRIFGTNYCVHRVIWTMINGDIPDGFQIDHINGNVRDNRVENLRVVSQIENSRNARRQRNNKTGLNGVMLRSDNGRYRVRINVTESSGKERRITVGHFDDFFEACCARKSAENRYNYHENHGR